MIEKNLRKKTEKLVSSPAFNYFIDIGRYIALRTSEEFNEMVMSLEESDEEYGTVLKRLIIKGSSLGIDEKMVGETIIKSASKYDENRERAFSILIEMEEKLSKGENNTLRQPNTKIKESGEAKYSGKIEDYIEFRGYFEQLIDIDKSDIEYENATLNLYRSGFRKSVPERKIGVCIIKSIQKYKEDRKSAIKTLASSRFYQWRRTPVFQKKGCRNWRLKCKGSTDCYY